MVILPPDVASSRVEGERIGGFLFNRSNGIGFVRKQAADFSDDFPKGFPYDSEGLCFLSVVHVNRSSQKDIQFVFFNSQNHASTGGEETLKWIGGNWTATGQLRLSGCRMCQNDAMNDVRWQETGKLARERCVLKFRIQAVH